MKDPTYDILSFTFTTNATYTFNLYKIMLSYGICTCGGQEKTPNNIRQRNEFHVRQSLKLEVEKNRSIKILLKKKKNVGLKCFILDEKMKIFQEIHL